VLYRCLTRLSQHYVVDEIPLLVYPLSYLDNQSIPYSKIYQLWAFDTKYTERFYEYMESIIPIGRNTDKMERWSATNQLN
jgi:hypothetical protein